MLLEFKFSDRLTKMFLDTRKFNFSLNSVLKNISYYLLIYEDELVLVFLITIIICQRMSLLLVFCDIILFVSNLYQYINWMRWDGIRSKNLFIYRQSCLCYFGAYLAVWEYCTPGLNTRSQCCFFSCFNAPATTVIIILWAVSFPWLVLLYIRLCQNLHFSS